MPTTTLPADFALTDAASSRRSIPSRWRSSGRGPRARTRSPPSPPCSSCSATRPGPESSTPCWKPANCACATSPRPPTPRRARSRQRCGCSAPPGWRPGRRDGRMVYYRLADDHVRSLLELSRDHANHVNHVRTRGARVSHSHTHGTAPAHLGRGPLPRPAGRRVRADRSILPGRARRRAAVRFARRRRRRRAHGHRCGRPGRFAGRHPGRHPTRRHRTAHLRLVPRRGVRRRPGHPADGRRRGVRGGRGDQPDRRSRPRRVHGDDRRRASPGCWSTASARCCCAAGRPSPSTSAAPISRCSATPPGRPGCCSPGR